MAQNIIMNPSYIEQLAQWHDEKADWHKGSSLNDNKGNPNMRLISHNSGSFGTNLAGVDNRRTFDAR
jgi:hypothetical protein